MSKNKESARERSEKRIPLGARASALTIDDSMLRKGYHRKWVNDIGGNIERHLNAWYKFVVNERGKSVKVGDGHEDGNSDLGGKISKVVDKTARLNSPPVRAYLMEIKEEYYKEDQAEKLKAVEEKDRQIREGMYKVENKTGIDTREIDYTY